MGAISRSYLHSSIHRKLQGAKADARLPSQRSKKNLSRRLTKAAEEQNPTDWVKREQGKNVMTVR